jgi:polyphosphate kinase 2 (PPK2 family)
MPQYVKRSGARICIVCKGRDTAGRGGTITALTVRVRPLVLRVVALPAPAGRGKTQLVARRHISDSPAVGAIVILDRSGCNRLGAEQAKGFGTPNAYGSEGLTTCSGSLPLPSNVAK